MKTNFDIIPDREQEKQAKRINKIAAMFLSTSIVLLIVIIAVVAFGPRVNFVSFDGNKYRYVEFPADIFYYDLKEGVEYSGEEWEPIPVTNGIWEMAYSEGDLYCIQGKAVKANNYYSDDANYDWFVIVENGDNEEIYPLQMIDEELEYIYCMEDMDKETAIFFEEIETMGSLIKVSKDGFIEGRTGLAQYEGNWYWRTETIDDSQEHDGEWPEYVIPLPKAVNVDINECISN